MNRAGRRPQAILGTAGLATLFAATLALGANRPVAWMALAAVTLALLAFQAVLDLKGHGLHPPLPVVPGLLFAAALGWGWVQILPAPLPGWAHPSWEAVAGLPGAVPRISADPEAGMHLLMRLASYGALFWIALRTFASARMARRALAALALFSSALSVYGLEAALSGSNPILGLDGRPTVVSASFVNRNSFATFAAFGLLANLALWLDSTRRSGGDEDGVTGVRNLIESLFVTSWPWLLGLILTGAAILLSQSRMGLLATAVGVAVLLSTQRGRGDGRLLAVLGSVFAFLLLTSATGVVNRFFSGAEEARFLVYPAVLEAIGTRPLLGHGLGSFHDVFRAWVPEAAATGEWDYAHQTYLKTLFELGMVGGASLFAALWLIVVRIWRGVRVRRRDRIFPTFALAAVATGSVHSAFDFSLQMPATAGVFAMILGLGWAQSVGRRGDAA